jgi:hypothetical protein
MGDIAKVLDVSKSTISEWVRDIELSEEQINDLNLSCSNGLKKAVAKHSELCFEQRKKCRRDGAVKTLDNDPLHFAGCMLYWAEGGKGVNAIKFANTDPKMVQLFVNFLRKCFGVVDAKISISVNCHLNNGMTLREIEGFWLETLILPVESLRKAQIVNVPALKKKNRHPYGVCVVNVCDTNIVQHIFGAIQEYTTRLDTPT